MFNTSIKKLLKYIDEHDNNNNICNYYLEDKNYRTFFSSQKAVYQIVTIRNQDLINNIFYTVAYGILINKTKESYIEFLTKLKHMFIPTEKENKRIFDYTDQINLHCDFEMALISVLKQVPTNRN